MEPSPLLEIDQVTKRFGYQVALDQVSMSVTAGEVRAVIGRNGAGKSTLVGVAAGFLDADAGTVKVGGTDTKSFTTARYREQVGMVHQHSTLVQSLSVAENLKLGAHPPQRYGLIHWEELHAQAQSLLDEWDAQIEATQLVGALTLAQRQLVEIVRELARGVQVVILDEPTSRLEKSDIAELFDHVRWLRERGTAVVYISHHMSEIQELCDSVTVLRDGRVAANRTGGSWTEAQLVRDMVGSDTVAATSSRSARNVDALTPAVFEVSGLSTAKLRPFDLSVRSGSCVGIAGLIGSGKEDVGLALGGLMTPTSGTIEVTGRAMRRGSIRSAQDAGIGFLSPDRHDTGLVLGMSVEENITMTIWGRLQNAIGGLPSGPVTAAANELVEATAVARIGARHQAVGQLSGGNQQKVAFGRAIANDPRVLVLMNPTTGVDLASKETIYGLIRAQLERGVAVLLVSDEVAEFGVCDQIVALFRGEVAHTFDAPVDEATLVAAIEGVGVDDRN